jgi:hypothetical protein
MNDEVTNEICFFSSLFANAKTCLHLLMVDACLLFISYVCCRHGALLFLLAISCVGCVILSVLKKCLSFKTVCIPISNLYILLSCASATGRRCHCVEMLLSGWNE